MHWKDTSFGNKLNIGFGLVLILLAIVSIAALIGIRNLIISHKHNDTFHSLTYSFRQSEVEQLQAVGKINVALDNPNITELGVEEDYRNCPFGKWCYGDKARQLTEIVPEMADAIKKMEAPHIQVHIAIKQIDELLRKGDPQSRERARHIYLSGVDRNMNIIMANINDLDKIFADNEARDDEATARTTSFAWWTVIIASVLALLCGVLMSRFITRSIAKPIQSAVDISKQLALGDTSISMTVEKRGDEAGQLLLAMSEMLCSLRDLSMAAGRIAEGDLTVQVNAQSEKDTLGNTLSSMVNNLRKQISDILEGIEVLAVSASELFATASQLSTSSTETAAALHETTATMEEVKQTTVLSNQKAQYVSDIAQRTSEASLTGEKSLGSTLQAMSHIREQMVLITESVVTLSEQSQAIGDIIASVDSLAEQSNLLAVNAAIEAAKAGEHGRGFTVVAQEVRSLAEQSKKATTQIRGILNDIQKATSAAVLSAEQGSKAVDAGVKQGMDTGDSIKTLTEAITETTHAAMQIAATSQQQLIGIDQIAQAMEDIRREGSQNVDSAKNLERAAQSLYDLGQNLKKLASTYRM